MDLVENTCSCYFCVDLWMGKDIEKVYTNNSEMTVEKRMSKCIFSWFYPLNLYLHGYDHTMMCPLVIFASLQTGRFPCYDNYWNR